MKWTKITDQRPRDGMYCLCKKRHGDGDFELFFATYYVYPVGRSMDCGFYPNHYVDRDGRAEVDYWMDAYALDNEASDEVE